MAISPTATEIRNLLEGYCVSATQISDAWIEARRDNFVIPYVERKTRQTLTARAQVIEYYSGNGQNILMLDRRPIVSLDAIAYVLGGLTNLLNLNNIEVIKSDGVLKAKRNYEEAYYLPLFAKGDKNLRVTYTYGFSTIPAGMKEAVSYLCAEQLLGFIGARTGGGSVGIQSYNRGYGERGKYQDIRNDLSRQAEALLRVYMTHVVGNA